MFVEQVMTGGVVSTSVGTLVEPAAVHPDALPTRSVRPTLPAVPAVYVMVWRFVGLVMVPLAMVQA